MSQTTKFENAPAGAIKYNKTMLQEMMSKFNITQNSIMASFGMSNPTTAKKWKNGGDLSFGALLALCNVFNLDLLRFINYAGHNIASTLQDIYRLELCGSTVADVLRERGIEPYDEENATHTMRTKADIEVEDQERHENNLRIMEQYQNYKTRQKNLQLSQLSAIDTINKITEIQQKAFEHEQEALEALRKQKDIEIAARDQTIINLRLVLARMGYQGVVADTNGLSMVSDTTDMGQYDEDATKL